MSVDEFMKQQYLTLRGEIRASKARIFTLLILATLFIPIAGVVAKEYGAAFASASLPLVTLVIMLAFVMEQNSVIRAGRYLKEHVEPRIPEVTTWESWLESNHKLRDMDRYFFATFLLIFLIFYAVGTGLAMESLATLWPEYYLYASVSYVVSGLWFVIVIIKHWRACTTTGN